MFERLYYYKANVLRIVDGDTILVDMDIGFSATLKNQRIRLLGINCPEIHGNSREKGLESKDYVESKISNKEVIIRTIKDDAFGRYLADVWYEEKGEWINLNDELLNKGLATLF